METPTKGQEQKAKAMEAAKEALEKERRKVVDEIIEFHDRAYRKTMKAVLLTKKIVELLEVENLETGENLISKIEEKISKITDDIDKQEITKKYNELYEKVNKLFKNYRGYTDVDELKIKLEESQNMYYLVKKLSEELYQLKYRLYKVLETYYELIGYFDPVEYERELELWRGVAP
jgi:hypothetical protein